MKPHLRFGVVCAAVVLIALSFADRVVQGQRVASLTVTAADLAKGLEDPTRWLTYSGDYSGARHSPLKQITPQNVRNLAPVWMFQSGVIGKFENTPLLFDGFL